MVVGVERGWVYAYRYTDTDTPYTQIGKLDGDLSADTIRRITMR